MARNRHLTGRLRRGRGWRLRLLWMLLGLIVVGAGLAFYQTRPHRLAAHGATILERVIGAEARIASAHLSSTGQLRLENVGLHLPGDPSPGGRLFEAEEIVIDPDLLSLLAGRPRARSIKFIRPAVHVIEHLDIGRFNFQLLPGDDDGQEDLPEQLPAVILRDATVSFGAVEAGQYHELGDIELAGVLADLPDQRGGYRFELHRQARAVGAGSMLSGQFNLRQHTFSITLTDFSFDTPESNFLPRRIRTVWQQFSPRGELPTVHFDADPQQGRRLKLELRRGELTLPFGGDAPRMTDVDGRFEIGDERIAIEGLTGRIGDIQFKVDGRVEGVDPRLAPFHLAVETEQFDLPDSPPLIFGLPPSVQHHYNRFSPSGRFKAQATIFRETGGEGVQYNGVLDLLGVRGAYFRFPYPLHEVTGQVVFNTERVLLKDIRGRTPGGGTVAVTGQISPPTEGSRVDIRVDARNVPLDDALMAAMEDKHRKVVDTLLDVTGYQRLLSLGLVRSGNGRAPSPVFELGGRIDVAVDIHRPLGRDTQFRVVNTITPHDVGVLLRFWRYPWVATGGSVVISPESIDVNGITLRGLSGATGRVSGRIDRPTRTTIAPQLALRDVVLPIDALLLESIPPPQDAWVRQAQLAGQVTAAGRIYTGEDGRADWDVSAQLQDVTAEPFGGGYRVAGIAGRANLTRDGIVLSEIQGHRGEAVLGVDGNVRWATRPSQYDLRFTASGLAIEPALLGLVPPELPTRQTLANMMAQYDLSGRTGAALSLTGRTDGQPPDYTLRLMPSALDLTYNGGRVSLWNMAGEADIGPDLITLESVSGDFEAGSFTVGGSILQGEQPRAALNFTASARQIDSTTRAVLPAPIRQLLEELSWRGGYEVTSGRLVLDPETAQGPRWRFTSTIGLQGAAADVGVAATQLQGQLHIDAHQDVGEAWPHIDLRLEASSIRVLDRLVSPLHLSLNNAAMPDVLVLSDCAGRMYGGELMVSGLVELGPQGRYSFDARMVGVDVDSFRRPDEAPAPGPSGTEDGFVPPAAPSGTVAASLLIEQQRGRPETRLGRGSFSIQDATLYSQPLPTALIEAINLRLPTTSRFDRASARFDIVGNQVVFESIGIESPALAIVGSGTMDWNSHALALLMYTRNPGGPDFGGLSDMFNFLKDELIAIRVGGTLGDPQATVQPLSGLTRSGKDSSQSPSPPPLMPQK